MLRFELTGIFKKIREAVGGVDASAERGEERGSVDRVLRPLRAGCTRSEFVVVHECKMRIGKLHESISPFHSGNLHRAEHGINEARCVYVLRNVEGLVVGDGYFRSHAALCVESFLV